MQGSDFVWIISIILGITVVGWLVLDWLESVQKWDTFEDADPNSLQGRMQTRSDSYTADPMEVELDMMLSYPLDPFAPSLLWRPSPQDEWIEAQEVNARNVENEEAAALRSRPSEAS
jgi:hypothetical protein